MNVGLSDMEPILECVNPYDVNPILSRGIDVQSALMQNTIEVQDDSAPKKSIKLEMEEFSDLAPYLPEDAQGILSNSIDELNTPVFDRKGPFDFTVYENTCIQPATTTADDPFKFEYELIRMNNSVLANNNNNKQQNDFSVSTRFSNEVNTVQQDINVSNNSEIVAALVQDTEDNNNTLLFSTSNIMDENNIFIIHNNNSTTDINNGNETPMHAHNTALLSANNQPETDHVSASSNIFKIDDKNSSVSDINQQISNVSSPASYTMKSEPQYSDITSPNNLYPNNFGFETPEDSNSGSEISETTLPKLKFGLNFLSQTPSINTPDLIDAVVDLETAFNVFDGFDDEKEITTINIEDIQFDPPNSTTTFAGLLNNTTNNKISDNVIVPQRSTRVRKRKRYDSDDDDYVPPTKKTKNPPVIKRKISVEDSESDSDSDFDEPITQRKLKRIKQDTAQRRTSVSSDHSDASKYRELRDKNNEASRKSRLKRKVKEMTLEKEADELTNKNIKLTAQVEELEKMVNNFRNNLFKIMLKK